MPRGRPRKGDTSERSSAALYVNLPPTELEVARATARRRGMPLVKVVREALADYCSTTDDDAPDSRTVPIPILKQAAK